MTNDLSQQSIRIFVSHSSKDNDFGVRLVEDLRRNLGNETTVWYDARGGLHGGDLWWRKIVEELTARNVFIVVLSPDAAASQWVNAEFDLALRQRFSKVGKLIIPILYRQCEVRPDLDLLQIIRFLPPKSYETAFNELLMSLGLPTNAPSSQPAPPQADPESIFIRQMTSQIEAAFAEQDWPSIIRRVNLLSKRAPGAVTSAIYQMQAIALREEGDTQLAREAFDTALALVSDREQRLAILRDYADFLASQDQWKEVQRYAREALRLAPGDSYWLALQEQVQNKLAPVKLPDPAAQPTLQIPQNTKEQWVEEGMAHRKAEQYNQAIEAYNHALTLDPKYAVAYNDRGYAYQSLQEYQKAIADCDRAIQLDPTYAEAYYSRGAAYNELKEYQKALADYDRAIQLDPDYTLAKNNREEAYRLLQGRKQKS
jgi:tetratricopeptide (TPR) repeat protein